MDYSNKKINFLHSKKSVKITTRLYTTEGSQLYLCSDLGSSSPKTYCLKIVSVKAEDKSANASINIEIVALLSLVKEQNIIRVIDYYSTSSQTVNTFFILMEYAEKGNLYEIMKKNFHSGNLLQEGVVWKYIYQIANGIKAIHNSKYAHRDIRPENILLKDGIVKICDFASCTNKFHDIVNHNIRSEILNDIMKNTSQYYRAPEELELYSGYPLSEKIDIFGLGMIMFMLLFNFVPNYLCDICFFLLGRKIKSSCFAEIKKILNPYWFELLRLTLKENPKERYSISDVMGYLEKYKDNLTKSYGFTKERQSFGANFAKYLVKQIVNELNSPNPCIRVLMYKLVNCNVEKVPDDRVVNILTKKTNGKMKKINKFFYVLSSSHILFYSLCGIKGLYVLHSYIFNTNFENFNPENFNLDEFLVILTHVYTQKLNNNLYDKNETIKNPSITKFIISYCEFIKTKIGFLRKYKDIITNNNAIKLDYNKLLNKVFIEDLLCVYIQNFQLISSTPFNSNCILRILDTVAGLLNIELVSLFDTLYYLLIAFNSVNSSQNLLTQFEQISTKASSYLDMLKKFRIDIHSKIQVRYLCEEGKLKEALDFLKITNPNFNMQTHFNQSQNYFGIKANISVSKDQVNYGEIFFGSNNNHIDLIGDDEGSNTNTNNNNNINNNYKSNGNDIFSSANSQSLHQSNPSNKSPTPSVKNENMINLLNDIFESKASYKSNNNQTNILSNNGNGEMEINFNRLFVGNMNSGMNNSIGSNNGVNNNGIVDLTNQSNHYSNNYNLNTNFFPNNASTNSINSSTQGGFNNNVLQSNQGNFNNLNNMNTNNTNSYSSYNTPKQTNWNEVLFQQPQNTFNQQPTQQSEQESQSGNSGQEYIFETPSSHGCQTINIYNIVQNHYSNHQVHNIDKITNEFLRGEFCKPNFQFLISSKDVKICNSIGFGGSSEVYLGMYRGTEVAVKKLKLIKLKEENLKEFKREVSSLSLLGHPNIVLFMGAIAEPENISIVTEYCSGGTLFNVLHVETKMVLKWGLRLRILQEIATGMNFLHTNEPPIIHRDLKSLNILLKDKITKPNDVPAVKISDFGLSKIIKKLDSAKDTMTGQLGTCHWMAPEVILSTNYTIKADVYSYGIIIWEVCTRSIPYSDMSQQQIAFYVSVKKGRPDKTLIPANTPVGLTKLMEMCWDDNPDNRPSFAQIISYLKEIKQNIEKS